MSVRGCSTLRRCGSATAPKCPTSRSMAMICSPISRREDHLLPRNYPAISFSCVAPELSLTLTLRARIIFAALAPDLVALAECGERITDRHLALLVALQAHPFQDFASGQPVALLDQL